MATSSRLRGAFEQRPAVFTTSYDGLVPAPLAANGYILSDSGIWVAPDTVSSVDIFGDGSDGDVTLAVNTTITRDMFYNTLVVPLGINLSPGGYRIFVKTLLTLEGTIGRSGNPGTAATNTGVGQAGGAATGAGTIPGCLAGGSGGNQGSNVGSTGGASATAPVGLVAGQVTSYLAAAGVGQGGAGGANSTGSISATGGGTVTLQTAANGNGMGNVYQAIAFRSLSGVMFTNGTGGGGGAGSQVAGNGAGGAGGASGAAAVVVAKKVVGGGSIKTRGGDGANADNSGILNKGGGGAGGSGGTVVSVIGEGSHPTIDNIGGTGGQPGGGGGTAGGNGGQGAQYKFKVGR